MAKSACLRRCIPSWAGDRGIIRKGDEKLKLSILFTGEEQMVLHEGVEKRVFFSKKKIEKTKRNECGIQNTDASASKVRMLKERMLIRLVSGLAAKVVRVDPVMGDP